MSYSLRAAPAFGLPAEGISRSEREAVYEQMLSEMQERSSHFLGYQVNQKLEASPELFSFLQMHLNNAGDPFTRGSMTMNTKKMEEAVLDYFAELWHAKTPHDPTDGESYWGYTLSMGSTEGNVYGIWNARDYLAGKTLLSDTHAESRAEAASREGRPARVEDGMNYEQAEAAPQSPHAYQPVAFFSQDTHYSIVKAMRVLAFDTFSEVGSRNYPCPLRFPEDYPAGYSSQYIDESGWPKEVPSEEDGSVHLPSLVKLVRFFVEKGYPIFVCFNYGTTFKGAYDRVEEAVEELVPVLKENGMYERDVEYERDGRLYSTRRNGFWFHVDGALGAAYMPFVEQAMERGEMEGQPFPRFDFRIPDVHSIVMSGHKWLGSPFPGGVFMTKTKFQLLPPDDPMYIGSPDTTFAGSRNSFSAMYLWDHLAQTPHHEQRKKAVRAEAVASFAENALREVAAELELDLWVERTPLSLTIRFRRPSAEVVEKYSLSCESLYVNGERRDYVHLFAMEHVTEETLYALAADLLAEGAYAEAAETGNKPGE
ncbi:pyridoxal-dependent decarboxylase [Alkalicoccus urumqiensis]|uniref:Histidine decarboxylase n=1 Tax=Alkalicoccus urumqiensis TaxID=1548213 RepID=A0A2P6MLR5_ALKUR|nr:pyridoxal-dependent decarboxylase [Alkalicoccus urumqiensis]PRO67234.1 histidine decarboxylase [Alkalicoccus urumqiensis]